MSATSDHSETHNEAGRVSNGTSITVAPTRTLAMIKPHALQHRLQVEQRISEMQFEIIKERQMEFDVDADKDILWELFGEDAVCFAEGPVWVYILERHDAVQTWLNLMGSEDPEVARVDQPDSLRAVYGLSPDLNGFLGSNSNESADDQIAIVFASSPPFPSAELPSDGAVPQRPVISRSSSSQGKSSFKARPVPATHLTPSIVPRTTRAAALRAGVALPAQQKGKNASTNASPKKTFENVPGHKRTEVIHVASVAEPTIAPRMTRAASLRQGKAIDRPARPRLSSADDVRATFDGVPGHKRRESIAVASVKIPTVAPRTNRSAALRAQKDAAPPSSYMFKTASTAKVPGLQSRRSSLSLSSEAQSRPSLPPSRASVDSARPSITRPPSVTKVSRPSSVAATTPTIAPRTNRSALLRAMQKQGSSTSVTSGTAKKPLPA